MRKSTYLLTTTPSSHTHRFHPLPLATPTSCSPHQLATPIHSTHSPQLSSILLTCGKFKVWMTIVESGWNVWVWLVGVGGIYGCGCKEVVYRYPHITYPYPYSSCICSFLQQHPYFLFIFLNYYVGCNASICTIHRLHCSKYGFAPCTIIHIFPVQTVDYGV